MVSLKSSMEGNQNDMTNVQHFHSTYPHKAGIHLNAMIVGIVQRGTWLKAKRGRQKAMKLGYVTIYFKLVLEDVVLKCKYCS